MEVEDDGFVFRKQAVEIRIRKPMGMLFGRHEFVKVHDVYQADPEVGEVLSRIRCGSASFVVIACAGDIPTKEALAAVGMLREYFPNLRSAS